MKAVEAAALVLEMSAGERRHVRAGYESRVIVSGPFYSDRDYTAADAWLVAEVERMHE